MGVGSGAGQNCAKPLSKETSKIISATIEGRPRTVQPGSATLADLLKALKLKEKRKTE